MQVVKYVTKHFKTWNCKKKFHCNRKTLGCLHIVFV